MAFFNDLGKKISQTSQDVVKKTKENSQVYKQEGLIAAEKRKIDLVYLQIGKLYHELHADSYEPDFEALMQEIRACEERISQCLVEIDSVRGVKKCPKCMEEIPLGAKFCNACGYKIEVALIEAPEVVETEVVEDLRKCTHCGAELSENFLFCTNCGAAVDGGGCDATE